MRSSIKSLHSQVIGLAIVAVAGFYSPNVLAQQLDSTDGADSTTASAQTTKQTDTSKKSSTKQRGFFEDIRGTIDFGLKLVDLTGTKPGKFEQFKDYRNAPTLRNAFLKFESANSPMFFEARVSEAGERDARYNTEFGR